MINKIINKIKFFFKKLKMSEKIYDELIFKSNCYNEVLKCINIDMKSEITDIRSKSGNIIYKFESSRTGIANIKVLDIITALGFEFSKEIKINIIK